MFKLDFLLKYNLDRETNDFILKRVRKMLAEKNLWMKNTMRIMTGSWSWLMN